MENEIGKLAGHIWQYLNQNGSTTTLQLKLQLGYTNTALFLSLGWLLRENKIVITKQEQTYLISLQK